MNDPRSNLLSPPCGGLSERDERLASLRSLAGQLAHDFNNFLAPLLGYITLIQEELPTDTPVQQYVRTMENAARKTGTTIERVVLATRAQKSLRRSQVNFAALIGEQVRAWQAGLPATCQIQVVCDLEASVLWIDEHQWREVVSELLSNARYALATGGMVRIRLAKEILAEQRRSDLGLAIPETFCLSVRDDGFGMDPAVLRRACEPFFSTRPKSQALGLGLALAHTVTVSHGGQIEIVSEPDAGTEVRIWLPALDGMPPGPELSACPSAAERGAARRKVLVVDDDPFVIEAAKGYLQRARFEVLTAKDPQDGLKLFRRHAASLSLVVSDIAMPGMNGIELAAEMRQVQPSCPLILMSGATDALGATDLERLAEPPPMFLPKPFKLCQLLEAIDRASGPTANHSICSPSRNPCN